MALPPQHITPGMQLLSEYVNDKPISYFAALTSEDLLLIGAFVQTYNFIELNLRRSVEVFVRSNKLGRRKLGCNTSELTDNIKAALRVCNEQSYAEDALRLDEIEERRKYRNLLAHWAARRIPDYDALIFFSRDESDSKRIDGREVTYDHCRSAIVMLADLRGLTMHIAQLDEWLASKMSGWYGKYIE